MAVTERARIDEFVEKNKEAILRDIARLVAIPSVEGEPGPGAPFGPGPRAALDEALAISKELGLAAHDEGGYIGWAEIPGVEPDKYLATITHLDVVPAGNGWDADPFTVRVRDGWLLGRGVSDDKGPTILCLYALKYLKESGKKLRYPVRALLGVNEETNMGDIRYYEEHCPMPVFCFTPDAEFPVCNGEKGLYGSKLVSKRLEGRILDFEGGVATNAVADRAAALVAAPESAFRPMEHITFEPDGKGNTWVRGWGVSGHASMPENTRSAIALVVNCLLESGVCTDEENAYLRVLQKLHAATDGSAIGIAADDGRFTPLTVVGGKISMENGVITQTVDSRYPTNMSVAKLDAALQAAAGEAARVVDSHGQEPFYIEADSPAIRTLIDTYNEVSGENKKPFTMGGGTYARHFPLAVSFGPEHTDIPLPEFAGPMHGANEGASWDKLLEALKIYILALERLEELDF